MINVYVRSFNKIEAKMKGKFGTQNYCYFVNGWTHIQTHRQYTPKKFILLGYNSLTHSHTMTPFDAPTKQAF